MPPPLIYDLSPIDMSKPVVTIEGIREVLPHRFEMEMLSRIVHIDTTTDTIVGVKVLTMDEFWVRGHIPGRPLMPGVLMIECAAQLCAFWTMKKQPEMGFVGFAKCDDTRFRGTVTPPSELVMIARLVELNRRRAVALCQGLVGGNLVFESRITGMSV
jgi:3-hydroxyacyl-[acyl-carrier-protein] dehydratase